MPEIPELVLDEYSYPRAALMLDNLSPRWWTKVSTSRLRMDSLSDCILGQIYGGYLTGLTQLAPSWPSIFRVTPFKYWADAQTWRDLIETRERLDGYPDSVFEAITQLDYVWPQWDTHIDVQTFNIYSPTHCIIGQLFDGQYIHGCAMILKRVRPLGLTRPGGAFGGSEDFWMEELIWRKDHP